MGGRQNNFHSLEKHYLEKIPKFNFSPQNDFQQMKYIEWSESFKNNDNNNKLRK